MLDILCSWNTNILSSLFGKIIKFSQYEHEEIFLDVLRMLIDTNIYASELEQEQVYNRLYFFSFTFSIVIFCDGKL